LFRSPITPTGLSSDKLFKVIANQSVVIIIQGIEVARDDIPFLIQQEWTLQMEDSDVLESVTDHEIDIAFQVGSVVDVLFLFQFIDTLAHISAGRSECLIRKFESLFG